MHVNCLSDNIKFLFHNSQLCSLDLLGVLSLLSEFTKQTQIEYIRIVNIRSHTLLAIVKQQKFFHIYIRDLEQ